MPNKKIFSGSLEWKIIVFEFGSPGEVLELKVTNEREPEVPFISSISETVSLKWADHLRWPFHYSKLFYIYVFQEEHLHFKWRSNTNFLALWKSKCWNWTFGEIRIDGCWNHRFEMPPMNPSESELFKNDELCNE